jgi:hypothetical protein
MAEWVEGDIMMGHAQKTFQPAKLFPMKSKETKASWHYDWRGSAYLATLNTGIGIAALATVGTIALAFSHHIFH